MPIVLMRVHIVTSLRILAVTGHVKAPKNSDISLWPSLKRQKNERDAEQPSSWLPRSHVLPHYVRAEQALPRFPCQHCTQRTITGTGLVPIRETASLAGTCAATRRGYRCTLVHRAILVRVFWLQGKEEDAVVRSPEVRELSPTWKVTPWIVQQQRHQMDGCTEPSMPNKTS